MSIHLYNTATRKKETFRPIEEGKVGIYACGVTVYDLCHIGHARSAIVFDVLVRYLRAKGFEVKYVRNFTDVDDKIIDRANKVKKEPSDLAEEFIQAFYEDMGKLRVLNADEEPRATEHINGMIEMIEALLDKGYAYAVGSDVFYSVEAFKGYGSLSGRKLEDMQAGSRIAVDEKKKNPMDFVLWKGAKPNEPHWESPWGAGRPGWHMECSVMSNYFLGNTFDIHGGGKDLLFPHHENERAQSIAANGGGFANYWVHNGFVTVESEKMSKSLGNFLTIRDALMEYHPEVIRLFLLSKHYRSPLDFSKSSVLSLQSGYFRIYRTLQRCEELIGASQELEVNELTIQKNRESSTFLTQFCKAMDDDLNTAGALGIIFDKVRSINKMMDIAEGSMDDGARVTLEKDRSYLVLATKILGLLGERPDNFFDQLPGETPKLDNANIEKMIEERNSARARKDWSAADSIRDQLKDMGVVLEDGPQGTTWRIDV